MAGAWPTVAPCPDDTCRAAVRRGSSHVIAAAIATSAAFTDMATTIAETNVPRSGAAPRAAGAGSGASAGASGAVGERRSGGDEVAAAEHRESGHRRGQADPDHDPAWDGAFR